MKKFEYKVVKLDARGNGWISLGGKVDMDQLNTQLSEMGEAGWELVSVEDTAQGSGSSRDLLLFFKREK